MKETRSTMGMPTTIELIDDFATKENLEKAFEYFNYVDNIFSPFKEDSEVSKINRGELKEENYSNEIKEIFQKSEELKKITNGYFDIKNLDGKINPSGLVKGWAIYNVAKRFDEIGLKNFYIEIAGDIEVRGYNSDGGLWRIGIKNPFNQDEIIKVIQLTNCGIATSGTYMQGQHIYNPITKQQEIFDVVSLTVISSNIYEADRFATPAFAMGKKGIEFIASIDGLEGYMIDKDGIAIFTKGFSKFVI